LVLEGNGLYKDTAGNAKGKYDPRRFGRRKPAGAKGKNLEQVGGLERDEPGATWVAEGQDRVRLDGFGAKATSGGGCEGTLTTARRNTWRRTNNHEGIGSTGRLIIGPAITDFREEQSPEGEVACRGAAGQPAAAVRCQRREGSGCRRGITASRKAKPLKENPVRGSGVKQTHEAGGKQAVEDVGNVEDGGRWAWKPVA
jgi:hypothetical protein